MPYKKRYRRRKRFRKKRYRKVRRKRYKNRPTSIRVFSPSAVPDTAYVKLKYNGVISMTNVAGFGTYRFALNGLFDPDITSTGHQPMAYDQWSAFYNNYEVKASKIRVEVLANSSVSSPIGFAMYPAKSATTASSFIQGREQPYSRSRWITGSNNKKTVTSAYMTPYKLEGRTTASVNFTAGTGANPSSIRYWHLLLESIDGSTIANFNCDVLITYYAKFFDRITLSQS